MSASALVQDIRATSPIATRAETAALIDVRPSRLTAWSSTRQADTPLVHTVRNRFSRLTIPLVGIAEASALNALLQGGMSFPEVRRAAEYIRDEEGDEFALANPRLLTDGTDAFIQDDRGLTRLKDSQGAIHQVIREHLKPLIIGGDGFVEAFKIERFKASEVTIDPRFNAGQMSFSRNRVPLFAVAGALAAGEKPSEAAAEFGLDMEEVMEIADNLSWLESFQ